jgi:hypothetical protein
MVPAPTLYGWDGKPLGPAQLVSPIDYGPGIPLPPRIPLPNQAPRESQYPIGWNLIPTPRTESGKLYSFAQLRAWADTCSYFRLAVEYRKMQVRARSWEVVPVEDAKSPAARRKWQGEIDRVKLFLDQPNRIDGLRLSTWLGQAVEECLVTDALVFHKQLNRGGDLMALVQIDGATIKPLIDQWGHVVGYQQILYGYPSTQYRAPEVEQYGAGELAYWIYKPRVNSLYGTSPLEEILPTILTAIKRTQTQLAWYTEGTVPDAFLEAPESWGPDQIAQYQTWLDNELSDTNSRRKLRLIPGGSTYTQAKPFAFSKEEEEAIASVVLAHMGVPKMILVSQVNRATAEVQAADSSDTGLAPLVRWIEENLTTIVQEDLGAPGLRVLCVDGLQGQSEAETKRQVMLVQSGVLTTDEARAELGRDPLTEEGDDSVGIDPALIQRAFLEAGVITRDELRATIGLPPAKEGGDQYITIGAFGITAPDAVGEAAEAPKPPPALAPFGGQNAKPDADVAPVADASGEAATADDEDGSGDDVADEPPAAKAERAEWRRFASKRFAKRRHTAPFETTALAKVDADLIRKALAAARTQADVLAAFEKAKKLTPKLKAKAQAQIKSAARKWFEAEYKVAREKGAAALAGNGNA